MPIYESTVNLKSPEANAKNSTLVKQNALQRLKFRNINYLVQPDPNSQTIAVNLMDIILTYVKIMNWKNLISHNMPIYAN